MTHLRNEFISYLEIRLSYECSLRNTLCFHFCTSDWTEHDNKDLRANSQMYRDCWLHTIRPEQMQLCYILVQHSTSWKQIIFWLIQNPLHVRKLGLQLLGIPYGESQTESPPPPNFHEYTQQSKHPLRQGSASPKQPFCAPHVWGVDTCLCSTRCATAPSHREELVVIAISLHGNLRNTKQLLYVTALEFLLYLVGGFPLFRGWC